MTEDNKMHSELDQRAESAFKKRIDLFVTLEELFNSYQEGITSTQTLRNNTDKKIREFSEGKIDTFNKIKKVVHNIEVYEKNKHKIYRKLTALYSRKDALSDIYKILIKGGIPQKHQLDKPMFTGYLRLYEEVFEPILNSDDDINVMFTRKDDYVNGINLFFSRLQEDIGDIEEEVKRLLEIETDVEAKLAKSKSQQQMLQKNYAVFTDLIKNTKMELGVVLKDERTLLSDYEQLLKGCDDLTKPDERVTERLNNSLITSSEVKVAPASFEFIDEVNDANLHKDEEKIENSAFKETPETEEKLESSILDDIVDGKMDVSKLPEEPTEAEETIEFEAVEGDEILEENEDIFVDTVKAEPIKAKEEEEEVDDILDDVDNALDQALEAMNEVEEVAEDAETLEADDMEGQEEAEALEAEDAEEEEEMEVAADTISKPKKKRGRPKKKAKCEESILAPAKTVEETEEKSDRDSILEAAEEKNNEKEKKKKDIEDIIQDDSKGMFKHDEHFLLDLSETLQ